MEVNFVKMAKSSHNKKVVISWGLLGMTLVGFVFGYFVATIKDKVESTIEKTQSISKDDAISQLKDRLNRVAMWGGKMMRLRDGVLSEMTEDLVLSNGTKVSKSGKIETKDGKVTWMKDGDEIFMNGTMMTR